MEKLLEVKKLMLEGVLKFRFRGTTLKYQDFLISLETIVVDKISPVGNQTGEGRHMGVGMAAKDDSEGSGEDQRIIDLALQAACKGTSKGNWLVQKRSKLKHREVRRRMHIAEGRVHDR